MEVLPEGLVLDPVPADADTEAEPSAGQQVDVGRLPRNERSLALREDEDAGGEADPLGDAGQVGEHHEWVVERIALGVGALERRRPTLVHGPQHVVVGQQVVEAEVLDRAPSRRTATGSPRSSICGYTTPICTPLTLPRRGGPRQTRRVPSSA